MKTSRPLTREAAEAYASWFRALADPTRVQILNLLACSNGPMRVGEIVDAVAIGQSTVSEHLKILAKVGFVIVEHRGTASLFRVNERCISEFPTAVELVMGVPPAAPVQQRQAG